MKLSAHALHAGYRSRTILHEVSLEVATGEILCLLGANGSGKTTLFRTMLRLLPAISGEILLDDRPIASYSQRELARLLAYVPQAHTPPFPFTVLEVVLMARAPHLALLASPTHHDRLLACEALETMGLQHLAHALYTELSGGERQLVLIARALAQKPSFMILDEPTSNLDFSNQHRVLRQIRALAHDGLGILMTTHYPDHAFLCASRVALLAQGRLLACGSPEETMNGTTLSHAFGCPMRVLEPEPGLRVVLPAFTPSPTLLESQ